MKKIVLAVWFFCLASFSAYSQSRDLPDFTELVEKQGAAVVNISTTQTIKGSRNQFGSPFPFDENDPAFELFRRFMPPGQHPGVPREYKSTSLGSGFVISGDGYVLTNAHVVDSADEVIVKLTDKREFKAKVLGADKRTDVALLKIDASNLPAVRLGDPAKLRVGEWVVAIGSPFGFESSVTAGIVSAKGRTLAQESYVPFIQTDVAINPGNSGGPLFNMKGEVVGINSQIYSRSGGYMGLAFAIPIDLAMEIQTQLKSGGKVSRGRLGVVIQEVSKELSESFGLGKPSGALVASVEKGAAADKAGIESGDIILKFDGKSIAQSSDLPRMVGATKPGSKVTVQVWRKGANRDISLTVGEMPDDEGTTRIARKGQKTPDAIENRLGLVLSVPSAEQRRSLGIQYGLVVEDVRNGATRTELKSGDIILSIIHRGGQVEIKTVAQFNELLNEFKKTDAVTLLVRRGESQTFITIKGVSDK